MFEIPATSILIVHIVVFPILLAGAIRILREYEGGVVLAGPLWVIQFEC